MEDKRKDSTGTPPPSASMTEAPLSEQPTSRRRGGGQKRKSTSINSGGGSSTPQTMSSKRQAREKPSAVPFPPIHMNGPCTRARVQPYNSNSFSEVAPVKTEAETREAAAKAEEMSRISENWEALEAKIEAEYEAIRSRDANVHVVPIHAGWFAWSKIHPLEERMLPSFFSGKSESRTPEIYMEIRNWIMKKFHLNPNTQIELKHLSELTVGELDVRQEVMEFLDYWGLINYHPFPHHDPAAMIVAADDNKDEAGKMESLVEKLFQFETVQSWTPAVPKMNMAMPSVSSGFFPESVVADELVKSEGPSVEYHCNSCSADCSRKRYHCQKQADFDLCADCFNNGKFGSDMSPSDFILMEPAEAGGASGGNWTDQETLLLLEAIELFRDNWSEIAEHVATKTKAQCILHFVQMPIEDAFLNRDDENNDAPKENEAPVSPSTENSAPKADRGGDSALKDVPEKTESQGVSTDNQDSSCPMEISKPDDVDESNKSLEDEECFALKALKEAFEAVGSSLPGERLSFAEAGNPVMTLAAFLVRLVEPNMATASVRSLLKSLSGNCSSEQLAARHCFPLEDPPDDKKNLAVSEGAATEIIEHEARKDEDESAEKQQEEAPDSVVDGISLRNDENDGKKDSAPQEHDEQKDSTSKDQKPVDFPSSARADRSDAAHEEGQPATASEPSNSPKEQAPKDAEESVVSASQSELQLDPVKKSEDGVSAGETSQSKEPLKDENMISVSEKKDDDVLVTSNSVTEKEDNTGDGEAKECGSDKKEPIVNKRDLDKNKLQRAAITALSAAAVKAKLLADQEEDQILQLSSSLIEKQLYKLEMKLAFFSDMENVVMRVKEQLDRSKQRLFQERAQIIATRFGMSTSARPTSQILPPNRAAVTFPNPASRAFMGMNSLRPPISRPMMTANPTSSNFVTASATGSSVPPNADRLSSVGMK
ncbi:SWI/SNF complex subunit SWI3D [Sesamum angolense]|uniref:SWI/SNF complex subunit SWI3D n=1 Tax=Sesamum angolense TaxID=2727404 RepID=A0AAE1WY33_9LAMI|nr:SWI/SNF complex subunit SWI3D [Sesamum angolense]